MSAVIAWVIVFAIICGCIFFWVYMLHRDPHSKEDTQEQMTEFSSCDGNCFSCAKNFKNEIKKPADCSAKDYEYAKEMMNIR